MAKPILIVEDSWEDAKILQNAFVQIGIDNPVQVLVGADQTIAYLKGDFPYHDRAKHPLPGIIFLDLKLPGIDGFEFLEWLKTHPELKDIGIIVISGVSDLETIRRSYALGANSFVSKPCMPEELKELTKRCLPSAWKLSPPPPI